ncbi:MAG: glutamyl-tRNA reductase [Burkholderiaceae bacterium]
MTVLALGLNHVTAPLALRERFAFAGAALAPAAKALADRFRSDAEVAILSTCNRTELYLGAGSDAIEPAMDWLAEAGGTDRDRLGMHTYVLEDAAAARHAFRVASGLDSMVLGEPQILGQFKHAMRQAESAGTLGGTLHQMFQRSFTVAKEVRSSTCIGTQSVSMAAACVRLASKIFERLDETRILFVGAGEMVELVATHFAAQHPRQMVFANRTVERARLLADRFVGEAMRLVDMPTRLAEFDIVVSCTASSVPIIGLGAIERSIRQRRRKPMFIVDLAVPRDVEPEVRELSDVYLHTVDDLAGIVKTNGARREAAVVQAEAIVEHGVADFLRWLKQRDAVPLIQALHGQADAWRTAEIGKARRAIARGEDVDAVLHALCHGMTQKMLHGAMVELKTSDGSSGDCMADTISRVFNIGGAASSRHA